MTISFRLIDNFDRFPTGIGGDIVYNELIPWCEKQGVYLSQYGNHAGKDSMIKLPEYMKAKQTHTLFKIEHIQRAFSLIPQYLKRTSNPSENSLTLKREIEGRQKEPIFAGDFIAAMLMSGFSARLTHDGAPRINCWFNADVI